MPVTDPTQLIITTAQQYGVDPRVAIEIAIKESGINQSKVSPKGAIGIMQVMPATAAGMGLDPRKVADNITAGVRYLKQMLGTFGSLPAALAAYNWGPGNVSAAIGKWGAGWLDRAPAETRDYVRTIMGRVGTEYQVQLSPVAVAKVLIPAVDQKTLRTVAVLVAVGLAAYVLAQEWMG